MSHISGSVRLLSPDCNRNSGKEKTSNVKSKRKKVGIEWKWLPDGKLQSNTQYGRYNSEAKKTSIMMSLFAYGTAILGTREELELGCKAIKEVMTTFEQRNNETKEERLVFGETLSHAIRRLGSWMNSKVDVQNRIKRAGHM